MDKKNKKEKTVQPLDLAWDMFRETGNIGYYMLFSRLNDENHE